MGVRLPVLSLKYSAKLSWHSSTTRRAIFEMGQILYLGIRPISNFPPASLVTAAAHNPCEHIVWSRHAVNRNMLSDVELQPLDVLPEGSHVGVHSRSRCARSGRRVQIGIHQDLFLWEIHEEHARG